LARIYGGRAGEKKRNQKPRHGRRERCKRSLKGVNQWGGAYSLVGMDAEGRCSIGPGVLSKRKGTTNGRGEKVHNKIRRRDG